MAQIFQDSAIAVLQQLT